MTLEADLNTRTLKRSAFPKLNRYGKEIAFSIGINEPIILNPREANLVVNELLHSMKFRNNKIEMLREKLQQQGFKIVLDPLEYKSTYNAIEKKISLGVKDHSDTYGSTYFHSANLSPEVDERILMGTLFTHECSHHIVKECINQPEMEELIHIIHSNIIYNGKALTKNTISYRGGNKIKEDITELIRMYIMGPEVLKLHLSFLSKTGNDAVLNKYNLQKIEEQKSHKIYNLIEKIVNDYLSV